MFIEYTNSTYINTYLNVTCYGHQTCGSDHYWGPGIRDYYLIHYIVNGSGTFTINNKSYELHKNNLFLIEPKVLAYYKADKETPWEYVWIGFNGTKAKHYLSQIYEPDTPPVFSYKDNSGLEQCIKEMLTYSGEKRGRDIILQSYLYKFIYLLITNGENTNKLTKESMAEKYVEAAAFYIANYYANDITINDAAKHVNVTRAYLYKLFKQYLDSSPQEFLINFRMEKACELLKNSNFAIGAIARSVGYKDVLLFSKIFKKTFGLTPTEYRKSNKL